MIAPLVLGFLLAQAATPKAEPEPEPEMIALTGLRILSGTRREIESGTLLLRGEKILAAGADVQVPSGAKILDRKGLTAFPGMLHPLSRLGMTEAPGAGGGAHHQALDEFSPVSESIPQVARSGVTVFAIQPSGTGIAGRGALIKPVGWTRREQVLDKASFLRIVLEPGTAPKESLRQALEGARKLLEADRKKIDEKTLPLVQFLKGELVALVVVASPAELLHFWQVLDSFAECTPRVVYSAGPDVYKAAAALGARKARVILRPVLAFAPYTRERINTAAELEKAGVQVAFAPLADTPEALEGVFFRVAELVKYGLSRDAGLRALTLGPAEMLGVDARTGSIDAGKDADFILLTGDPLSPQSRVQEVYINGRPVFPVAR